MTLRANALAAALLAAALSTAAGCSLDLAQYEPKTDDDCGGNVTGLKACGYRCVPIDDPATGCWEVENVCNPCPGPLAPQIHMVPACESETYGWPVCAVACVPGWGDCDGVADNGCEANLAATSAHCGACGHACASCTDGLCPSALVGGALPATPVDLDTAGAGVVFVVDQGDGGALRDVATPGTPLVSGLGAVRRLKILSSTQGFVSGVENLSGTDYGTLWKVTDLAGTPAKASWANTTGLITDFAPAYDELTGTIDRIAYAVSDATGYRTVGVASDLVTATHDTGDVVLAISGDPTGWYDVYTGTSDGYLYGLQGTSGGGLGGFATPARIAAFKDASDSVTIFSASAADGSVSLWPGSNYIDRIIAGAGPTTAIDIHADAAGVYWCDATAGVVRGWRASDGFVYDLARGGQPVAVTSSATHVFWADAADNRVRSVLK